MATYPPPSFYSNIFDSNAFAHGNPESGLTEQEADLLYYKYPIGQAYETLQQTDHTGLAEFQAGIDIVSGTLTFPDNTVQTTAFTGSSSQTLAQTLVLGNSAGSTDINMNNNDINNCATINSVIITTGVLTTNLNVGTPTSNNYNLTTTGNGHNTAMGDNIMSVITTGNYNNAVGSFACNKMTTGLGNEAFGANSLQNNTTGGFNCAVGNRAGEKNIGGSYNIFVGAQAGENRTIGDYNTVIGQGAGVNDNNGSRNTYIGSGATIGGGVSDSTVVGVGATTSTANTIQLGRTSENVNCPNTLSVASTTVMSNTLSMNSTTAIANRQISSTYYNFYASNNIATLTYSGRFYGNLNSIVYDCPDTNSSGTSAHIFYCYNIASVRNVLQLNYASASMSVPLSVITPTAGTSALTLTDSTHSDYLTVIPYNTTSSFNAIVQIGDTSIVASSNSVSTNNLSITTWSGTNVGVRMTDGNVRMGAGGTGATPTSYVETNGATVRVAPSITFPDNTVQTTAFTGATVGINQMWSWSAFDFNNTNQPLGGNAIREVNIVLPYSSSQYFSTSFRIEFNYAVFCNNATTITPIPSLLSSLIATGGTNVNPNTISLVDLIFNPTTQAMDAYICQSTYAKIFTNQTTTLWRGNNGYNYVPIKFDPIAPLTLNSPSAGYMTVKLNVAVPNINYSSNPNYQGNLCSFNTSVRIVSSQATTTNTVGLATYSSGVAYFI